MVWNLPSSKTTWEEGKDKQEKAILKNNSKPLIKLSSPKFF